MREVTTKSANVNNGTKSAAASKMNVRYLTVTAMLSAIAFILMFLDFSVPVMPNFIRMDLSELPALIGAFAMGPACGVWVCLVKNLLHLFMTSTGGVGELSNFVLGAAFVLPAGLIYKYKKNKKSAITGALIGALCMALFSFPSNYFVVYRFRMDEPNDLSNPAKIVSITSDPWYSLPYDHGQVKYRYVVTAVDRFHNESQGKAKKVKL